MKLHSIPTEALSVFRKALEKFVYFNEEEWALFIQHLSASTFKKKDHFAYEGEICNYIGFILSGSVRYYHMKDGEDITGYFSFEGEFVSSYKSFLTQEKGTGYIQALEPSTLLLIAYNDMQKMLNHSLLAYKMEHFGRLVAEHYICCYEERISSFITQSPEERYLNMMLKDRAILLRVPQHYIANFLGITPVSLSRIRKRLLYQ
ncbi:Crp/Fnr family transcriptional regulator [Pedobacter sp. HMWF019]|uniref:Crp/Fnr family transcriptional regulator n=1 Tax=Pedobacter sp. HMWF019 TaxID=2056856 RepID=UPI000D3B123C|nr:Crp/Fnr family transcriptional regulator [Pedobacter sp. HMWF019]PTS93461.1 Crp/Fnr family transcriptional regulator [Pedobacter sp. HMWF019]